MDKHTAVKRARRRAGPTLRIETYSKKPLLGRRQYRARVVNEQNGKVQWVTSEGYNNRADLMSAIYALEYAGTATIVDLDAEPVELGI
jgi:ribonuclease HI